MILRSPCGRHAPAAILVVAGLLALLPPSVVAASGADAPSPRAGGYLTFYLDNDLFGGTDRNYTNGARLSWISEGEPLLDLFPARRTLEQVAGKDGDYPIVRAVSGFHPDSVRDGTLELNYGLSLTQLMFTPADPAAERQPAGERRYAGWLGLGFSVHARDARALNSAELIFGTTGEHSLAQQTQDLVHEVKGVDRFQGWDDQIPSEPTVDLSFAQKRRAQFLPEDETGFSVDGLTQWGLRLGTFRTEASFGGLFRAGLNLPVDFSDPRLSATAYSHRYFGNGGRRSRQLSVYGLFGFQATAVAHDATLDGPLFDDFDTGNTRAPLVGELSAGFAVRWQAIEFGYLHTLRTEQFQEDDGAFNFGSLSLRLQL